MSLFISVQSPCALFSGARYCSCISVDQHPKGKESPDNGDSYSKTILHQTVEEETELQPGTVLLNTICSWEHRLFLSWANPCFTDLTDAQIPRPRARDSTLSRWILLLMSSTDTKTSSNPIPYLLHKRRISCWCNICEVHWLVCQHAEL